MTSELGDSTKLATMIEEAKRLGLKVLPPSVNRSQAHFTIEEGEIRFGMLGVKGVGTAAIEAIVEAVEKKGPFDDLFSFCQNLNLSAVNKKTVECLILAGALDEFEGHRAQLFENLDDAYRYAQRIQADEAAGQSSLFGTTAGQLRASHPSLKPAENWTRSVLLKKEREVMGFYVSGHPLESYAPEVRAFSTATLADPDGLAEKPQSVCGIITEVRERTQKNGRLMAFFTLEDFHGHVELALFGQQYEQLKEHIKVDRLVMIKGTPIQRGGQLRWKVTEVIPMQRVRDQMVRSIILKVDTSTVRASTIKELLELCERNRGSCKLYFDVEDRAMPERVRLRSRSFVVDPSPELVQGITRLFGGDNIRVMGES
jgi:DNA polymerase-3 subunit alpha